MAFIDILEKAGNTAEASYIKFLHQYKFQDRTLHLFFEGLDDQSFYVNFIRSVFPNNYNVYYYVCNGKDNVYSNYTNIDWSRYIKSRVLFFTDKDLDDIIQKSQPVDENIFTTQYYSVENYLVTAELYMRFLRELCCINDEQIIESLKVTFEQQLLVFSQRMVSICAWIIFCRRNMYPVNLNDIDISKIFQLSKDFQLERKVASGYRSPFDYICKVTKSSHFNSLELKEIIRRLEKISCAKVYIRGKYELWFLYEFCKNTVDVVIPELNKKIKEHNRTQPIKRTKCKTTISIKPENIFQIMAPRVVIPEDLLDFLNRNNQKLSA